MKWVEKVFYMLFPGYLAQSTPWHEIWKSKERADFLTSARVFFPVVALSYILHYFFFDKPMGLEPLQRWFLFRASMALLALLAMVFYMWAPLYNTKYYKVPHVVSCWTFCYLQAWVSVWYPEASYLFAFGFVVVSANLLKASPLKSMLYALVIIATQYPVLVQAGVSPPIIASSAFVTLVFILFSRASQLSQIKYFIAQQENLSAKQKIIEINIEFTEQIKAFLPREISRRLTYLIKSRKMSVLQATSEVLRPKKKSISCLFSDIRGFTQGSKDLDTFVHNSVLPNVKLCTEAIEGNNGIPRKIGDLIFSYYDDDDERVNLLHAITSGVELSQLNNKFNRTIGSSAQINRHVLVATGPAIVGNLGGFNSSVEITALGSPVNFLSRLDEVTKNENLKEVINYSDVLICAHSADLLMSFNVDFELKKIDLPNLDVKIRDFEEVKNIWVFNSTAENFEKLKMLKNFIDETTAGVEAA